MQIVTDTVSGRDTAIDGAGVVLGRQYLAADDIAAGRLVQPFSLVLPLGSTFYLVYPEAYADRPKVVIFRDWLVQETKNSNSPERPPSTAG